MDKETKELCRLYEKRIVGLEEEVNRYKSLVDIDKRRENKVFTGRH